MFFGDGHANVFALDAQTGRQLWKTRVDDHVVARITGSVKYHDGRVYVPISGSEEFNSGNKDYPCCTARGGVAALDANTGKELWKTYLADEPKPWKKNRERRAVVWTGDRRRLEFADDRSRSRRALRRHRRCGDAAGIAAHRRRDGARSEDRQGALVAPRDGERSVHGRLRRRRTRAKPCPSTMGPDYDIGNSPILVTLPNGKRALFAGTKGADVLALDPDANGAVLFRVNPSGQPVGFTGRGRGGIVWGGAADQRQVYYGMGAAGLGAVQSADGKTAWVFTAPGVGGRGVPPSAPRRPRFPASSSRVPATAGSSRCRPRTASNCGSSTPRRTFETVNKVPARGGAIATAGAVVVDGMVYVGSGLRDQQRRVRRQCAAGVWCRVRARRTRERS